MLQRFQEFFKVNNCKLLLKYDGERSKNKYTVRLFYKGDVISSKGQDTDEPYIIMSDLFDNSLNTLKEIMCKEFNSIFIDLESNIKTQLGESCILSFITEHKEDEMYYTLLIELKKKFAHYSSENIKYIIDISNNIELK